MRFSSFPLICFCLLMAGCSSQPELLPELSIQESKKLQQEQNLPAISLFYRIHSEALSRECEESRQSLASHCQENALDASHYQAGFEGTNLFPLVMLEESGPDYELILTTASFYGPQSEMKAELLLAWRGILLKEYRYSLPLAEGLDSPQQLADQLVSYFVSDALSEGVFGSGYLARTLKSDDYEVDLKAPNQVSNFKLSKRLVYNDPLEGSTLTYQDPDFDNDRIEVSVYPIPTSDLSNLPGIIEDETDKLRKNLTSFAREHSLPPLFMSEDILVNLQVQGREINGYYLDASIESSAEPFYASYFFFIQHDKIVKFTTTFPSSFAMDFVKQALPQMQIPSESPFMSRLRSIN
ncbi:hypothetical protein [Bowmanella dokdonensis]|uniref:Lipoprotein n=1 Tax=Bowmanella dokdonensis TaxID=751969 RepID=A0A939DNG9_9ALTE|nr:hypothetical protein [Bowmanella dokdonensis]MBN7825830.1 hypothetical protein [Bowmanella dokdonensis]